MKILRFLLAAAVLAPLAGCFKHTIRIGKGADTSGAPKHENWQIYILDGLIGENKLDVNTICP